MFAEARQRRARYVVSDPFLSAWLNVLQPACQAARIQPASQVAQRLLPRLATLEGHAFERLVRDASEEASHAGARDFPMTDRARGYWNRPQPTTATIEIDLVAWNDAERRVRFGSCKRNSAAHNATSLREFHGHVNRFLSTKEGRRFREWHRELVLFSPEFAAQQRARLEADRWICRDLLDFQRMLLPVERGTSGTLPPASKVAGAE